MLSHREMERFKTTQGMANELMVLAASESKSSKRTTYKMNNKKN